MKATNHCDGDGFYSKTSKSKQQFSSETLKGQESLWERQSSKTSQDVQAAKCQGCHSELTTKWIHLKKPQQFLHILLFARREKGIKNKLGSSSRSTPSTPCRTTSTNPLDIYIPYSAQQTISSRLCWKQNYFLHNETNCLTFNYFFNKKGKSCTSQPEFPTLERTNPQTNQRKRTRGKKKWHFLLEVKLPHFILLSVIFVSYPIFPKKVPLY